MLKLLSWDFLTPNCMCLSSMLVKKCTRSPEKNLPLWVVFGTAFSLKKMKDLMKDLIIAQEYSLLGQPDSIISRKQQHVCSGRLTE